MALKILIAEDDRHTRKILEHIFTKDPRFAGTEVRIYTASDGQEALEIFEKERPDLVISDLLMPRLDGFALCRAIRKLPYGRDVPIIVTSAIYKETALLNRMKQELGVEFFAKPFQVRPFLSGVQRLLGGQLRTSERSGDASEPDRLITGTDPVKGALSRRPLAALIFDALEGQATGQLLLRRGKIRKTIYFILGSPVAVESNVRSESVPQYFLLKRILDEAQVSKLLSTAKREGQGVLQTLVSLGWLTEEEVFRHYAAIVKFRIINGLRWEEGSFEFVPGDTFSGRVPRVTIDGPTVVLLGLKRVINPEEVARRFEPDKNRRLTLTTRASRFRDVYERVFGRQILDLLSMRPSLAQLLDKGVEPIMVYTQVHALRQTDMVQMGEVLESERRPVETKDPLDLDQLARASQETAAQWQDQAEQDVVYREMFGVDEISVVANIPDQELSTQGPSEDSQVVEIPISVEAQPTSGDSAESVRKMILASYLEIQDKNYYDILGVSPEATPSEIEAAYKRLLDKFDPAKYADMDLGPDHPKLEEIVSKIRQAHNVLVDPTLRADYDRSLVAAKAPRTDPLEAELRFREGEQHLKGGRCQAAVASFEKAVAADPDVADYHAYLAWARYCGQKNRQTAEAAMSALNKVLDMDPDSVPGHFFLALVLDDLNRDDEAAGHLETVLDLDPENEEAFRVLYDLLSRNGAWGRLEKVHRMLLQKLESKKSRRVGAVWKSLGRLYAERLGDHERARTCLERALELDPSDQEVRDLASQLEDAAASWPMVKDKALTEWAAQPTNLRALEELYGVAQSAERWEEAYVLASVLVGLGSADASAAAFHRRFRPRFLQRARRDLDESSWEVLVHPNDDPAVAEVFSVLEEAEEVLGAFGQAPVEAEPLAEGQAPHIQRVYEYLAGFFGVRSAGLLVGAVARPVPLGPFSRALVVPQGLLSETDHIRLAAELSVGLGLCRPGRSLVAHLSSKQGKDLVTAIMVFLAPKLKVADPEGRIADMAARIDRLDEARKSRLRRAMAALTRQRKALSISKYYRAVQATCGRMAFLASGDFVPVLRAMSAVTAPEVLVDVVRFYLSDPGLRLRYRVGLSLVV